MINIDHQTNEKIQNESFSLQNRPIEILKESTNKALEKSIVSKKQIMIEIEKLIDTDLERAKILLSLFTDKEYIEEIFYLKSRVLEKETYLSYDEETKNNYHKFLNAGKAALKAKKYEEAFSYFQTGMNKTRDNIFNYYIGKNFYKAGYFIEARAHLEEYIRNGGSKYSKALFYLILHASMKKEARKFNTYNKKMRIINNLTSSGFAYSKKKSNQRKCNPSFKKRANQIEKKESTDVMTTPDFEKGKNTLSIENYYEYDIDSKIELIKKLFQAGKNDVASNLLEELKNQDSKAVERFLKKKK